MKRETAAGTAPPGEIAGVVHRNIHALLQVRRQVELQISLLAEHEITRLLEMVEAIGHKLDVSFEDKGLQELKKDVAPEKVLAEIEHASGDPPPH